MRVIVPGEQGRDGGTDLAAAVFRAAPDVGQRQACAAVRYFAHRPHSQPTMSDLAPLPTLPPGHYRHFKGGNYEVIGVVRHSETLEPLVLYRPLDNDAGLWVRPYAMFCAQVEVDGQRRPRFAQVPAGA